MTPMSGIASASIGQLMTTSSRKWWYISQTPATSGKPCSDLMATMFGIVSRTWRTNSTDMPAGWMRSKPHARKPEEHHPEVARVADRARPVVDLLLGRRPELRRIGQQHEVRALALGQAQRLDVVVERSERRMGEEPQAPGGGLARDRA